jgi:hypothetical protein
MRSGAKSAGVDFPQRRRRPVSLPAGDPRRGASAAITRGRRESKPTLFAFATRARACRPDACSSKALRLSPRRIRGGRGATSSRRRCSRMCCSRNSPPMPARSRPFMLERGELTEGSSTTVHVIAQGRDPYAAQRPSHPSRHDPRCGRRTGRALAGCHLRSRRVARTSCARADEIWLAFATRGLLPVTRSTASPWATGKPGPLFERMHDAFLGLRSRARRNASLL